MLFFLEETQTEEGEIGIERLLGHFSGFYREHEKGKKLLERSLTHSMRARSRESKSDL